MLKITNSKFSTIMPAQFFATIRSKNMNEFPPLHMLLSLLLALTLTACGTGPTQTALEKETQTVQLPQISNPLLAQTIETHGGLAAWKSFGTMEFDLVSASGDNRSEVHSLLNLHSRHERITGSNYELGYDGKDYWQWLKEEGMKEMNPTFYINLQFYFFAMPFVLTDEGVKAENLGEKQLAGKTYEVIKITFDAGTGVAPDDQYIVYVDPASKQMEALLYSVTYFNKENAERYSALRYTEWQEVNGLKLPKTMVRHRWDAEKEELGEERGTKTFLNVRLVKEEPSTEVFAKPEGAL